VLLSILFAINFLSFTKEWNSLKAFVTCRTTKTGRMIAQFTHIPFYFQHLSTDRLATGGTIGSEERFIILLAIWLTIHHYNLLAFKWLLTMLTYKALRVPFAVERGEYSFLRGNGTRTSHAISGS